MKKARKVKRKIKRKYVRAELFLQILICLSGRTNFSLRAQVEAAKQKRTLNFDLHSKFRDPILFLVETSLLVEENPKLNFLGCFQFALVVIFCLPCLSSLFSFLEISKEWDCFCDIHLVYLELSFELWSDSDAPAALLQPMCSLLHSPSSALS